MKHWIAVASAEHVHLGRAQGFMQVCHGKGGPLARISPGDRVVYYSPSEIMGVADGLNSFTAIGDVREGRPYQVSVSESFHPFRRDISWFEAKVASIRPLLEHLALTRGKRNWGYGFRFGLVEVSGEDMQIIAQTMGARPYTTTQEERSDEP